MTEKTQTKDVGIIYEELNEVDSSKDIKSYIDLGVSLGHPGVVKRSLERMVENKLEEKGASEEDLGRFLSSPSLEEKMKVMRNYGINERLSPTNTLYQKMLQNAVGTRGYSIEDQNTAVGECFQELHGSPKDIPLTKSYNINDQDGNLAKENQEITISYGEIVEILSEERNNKGEIVRNYENGKTRANQVLLDTLGYEMPENKKEAINGYYKKLVEYGKQKALYEFENKEEETDSNGTNPDYLEDTA